MSLAKSEKAENLMKRLGLKFNQILAIRFAVNVGIGTIIVCVILYLMGKTSFDWAVISVITCSDPQPKEARKMVKGRLINVIVGCAVGLIFILIGEAKNWMLPVAVSTAVLISSLLIRIKEMWLQAPITAAIVISSALGASSNITGMYSGIRRVEDVLIGSCVGFLISWIMSKFWFIKYQPDEKELPAKVPNL